MPDFLKVEDVLQHLVIKKNMIAAEFGCGSAEFTIALAKKVNKGKVYALDIQEEKLSSLQGRMKLAHITNVVTVWCDLEVKNGSKLPDDSLDVVLIPNMLFQVEDKNVTIEESCRILKKGGQLLIIDWLKQGPFSPKTGMLSPEKAKQLASMFGFSLKKEFAAGDYHYALLFTK